MTGNRKLLTNVTPHKGAKIVFGDNAYGNTVGKGKIIHGNISITDVLVVDNIRYNLISISQLCDKGYIVKFQQHTCTVQSPSGLTVFIGKRSGNTYIINWSDQLEAEHLCLAAGSSKSWLWHQRMNHLNFKTLAKLSEHDMISGLPKNSFSKDKICAACQLGKQIKSNFKNKGGKRSTRCLELLHMDLFGPISVTSLGGTNYTLAVVDDFSKYTWVLFLKEKSETADQLIRLLKRLQNDRSCSVNQIRSDRGTEFLNFKLTSYLEDLGIKHELSAARTPQQNGLAEREPVDENVERVVEPVPESVEQPAVTPDVEAATDDPDAIIEKVLDQMDSVAANQDSGDQPTATIDETIPCDTEDDMDLDEGNLELPIGSGTDAVVGTDVGNQQEQSFDANTSRTDAEDYLVKESNEELVPETEKPSADEAMSLEDILMTIPVEVSLPSASVEITRITLGKEIHIPGVTERTWYLAGLPQIPVNDKGKEPLLRLKWDKLQQEDFSAKIEQVLTWAETDSTIISLQRKVYVLLKYREMLLRKFIEARTMNFVPGEGRIRDRGAVIAQSNTKTKSSCWIRTMLLVDVTWVIEPCADYWKPIPRAELSSMVIIPSRLSYVDTLPPMREFFKLLRKIWADVCIEVAQFFASGKLLPVGSITFCRGLSVVEPVASFAPRQPTVFAMRVSQFCTVFIEYSFFSSLLTTVDFSYLRSVVIADRGIDISVDSGVQRSSVLLTELLEQDVQVADSPVFESHNVQIDQNSALVAPSVQLLDEHLSSASTSETSDMNFDETDIATTVSCLPTVSTDLSTSLANLQTILSEHIDASQGGILSKLHKIEQGFRDSLRQQEKAFKTLIQGARQERRNIDIVQTLRFNEFCKNVLAQNASVFTGLTDVRKEVQEINAKVDIVATCLNEVRKDVEATKEAISHLLLEFQSQAQANYIILTDQLGQPVDYINRGGNAKKGEGESSRGPQPPPAVQIRDSGNAGGSGDAVRTTEITQADIDAANRQILESMMREDRERERERRSKSRSGSYKRRRY
ncbi:retrovirus-related Pol polyprotein from transposon TNT 1-94 [Dorcoceras hygrometricum]|uniref:Retrovirus-related Pol polyprotein from transposon TNT 1-94 n=1 Tax=Dorcoceras hygrometricum TaxID=472368 RepID=A0A2Z7AED3_9LAMI|nr:retrovirus-related Pol polyprotein from transposon TNT 1-94 [Dorcoceras hygrometricum]